MDSGTPTTYACRAAYRALFHLHHLLADEEFTSRYHPALDDTKWFRHPRRRTQSATLLRARYDGHACVASTRRGSGRGCQCRQLSFTLVWHCALSLRNRLVRLACRISCV